MFLGTERYRLLQCLSLGSWWSKTTDPSGVACMESGIGKPLPETCSTRLHGLIHAANARTADSVSNHTSPTAFAAHRLATRSDHVPVRARFLALVSAS
jgi:hypothetical protein